jgi:hypothetical protein
MRWHYITGAIFGLVTVTWVFSGWMSMNPGDINPPRTPTAEQKALFAGDALPLQAYGLPSAASLPEDVRELETMQFRGEPLYRATLGNGDTALISASESGTRIRPDADELLRRAPGLMPGVPVAKQSILPRYDDYYYTRHPERGEKPLPVIRIEFADGPRTWFHIDAKTGQVMERSTSTHRLFRWLYNGLHSWDIRWLWERRPLWDIAVIAFCGGGLVLSIIGVIAGVRRLRWDFARANHRRAKATISATSP